MFPQEQESKESINGVNGRHCFIVCLSYPITATVVAWRSKFKGESVDRLLKTISDYLDEKRDCYARLSTIVNSSGTGKSRMVDQLSMQIITVPMCLRTQGGRGLSHDVLLVCWHAYL